MANRACASILLLAVLTIAGTAWAADPLTTGDLGWLRGNLNLAGDSPAVLDLTAAQKSRLHALIAARGTIDRKRQAVVQFLTVATDRSLDRTLDASTLPDPTGEMGANRPR